MFPAELYGRVLRVNYAQPMKIKGGDKGWASQPVWADADDWCAQAASALACSEAEGLQKYRRDCANGS